jgi:hypothetical protein
VRPRFAAAEGRLIALHVTKTGPALRERTVIRHVYFGEMLASACRRLIASRIAAQRHTVAVPWRTRPRLRSSIANIRSLRFISPAHVRHRGMAHFLPPNGAFFGRRGLATVMRYSTDFPSQCAHALRAGF